MIKYLICSFTFSIMIIFAQDSLDQAQIYLKKKQYQKSIDLCDVVINEKLSYLHVCKALEIKGINYHELQKYQMAISCFDKGIAIIEGKNSPTDKKFCGLFFYKKAFVYQVSNKYQDAITNYKISCNIYKKIELFEEVTKALFQIGVVYSKFMEKNTDALLYFKESLQFAKQYKIYKYIGDNSCNIATILAQQYNWNVYPEIEKYYLESIGAYSEIDSNIKIACTYYFLGKLYHDWSKENEAMEAYQNAVTAYKKLRNSQEDAIQDAIAECYNSIGVILNIQNKLEASLKFLNDAYEIYKQTNNLDGTIKLLINISDIYRLQGSLEKSEKNLFDVLELSKKNQYIFAAKHNLALLYESWGNFAKAEQFYFEAIACFNGEAKEKIVILNNFAFVYVNLAKYKKALSRFNEALDIAKSLGNLEKQCYVLVNMSFTYLHMRQLKKAKEHCEDAYKIAKNNKIALYNLELLSNLAFLYYKFNLYEKAIEYYNKSLEIRKNLKMMQQVAITLNNLGLCYQGIGNQKQAIQAYQDSLEINILLKQPTEIINNYQNIAWFYYKQNQYTEAITFYQKAIHEVEKLLDQNIPQNAQRDYFAKQIVLHQYLLDCHFELDNKNLVYEASEKSKAKFLAKELQTKLNIPSIQEIQNCISNDTAIISYANTNFDEIIQIVITKKVIHVNKIPKHNLLNQLQSLINVDKKNSVKKTRRIKIVPKFESKISEENEEESYLQLVIESYLNQIKNLESHSRLEKFAKVLYQLLIQPAEKSLIGKKELIIVPDGALCFVPFETLVTPEGKYLIEKFHIRYSQSIKIFHFLNTDSNRQYDSKRKDFLGFGGAVYNVTPNNLLPQVNIRQLTYLDNNLDFSNPESIYKAYDSLGITQSLTQIPGTLNEVTEISKILLDSKIVTGQNVTKKRLQELSQEGSLLQYKIIHFATHGIALTEIPELSALVFSLSPKQHLYDSFLHTVDITELKLKTDFVNLSGCETAIGKLYQGEGIVGLTQAFLIAGANSVCASLWPIDDEATSLFMKELYTLLNKGITYDQAIRNVKRKFIEGKIQGKYGQDYSAPYYWAPFAFYGKSSRLVYEKQSTISISIYIFIIIVCIIIITISTRLLR